MLPAGGKEVPCASGRVDRVTHKSMTVASPVSPAARGFRFVRRGGVEARPAGSGVACWGWCLGREGPAWGCNSLRIIFDIEICVFWYVSASEFISSSAVAVVAQYVQ